MLPQLSASFRKDEDGQEQERVNSGNLSVSEEATDDFPMQDKINWRALEAALLADCELNKNRVGLDPL